MSRAVCALAPDADAPRRALSPSALGSGRSLGHDLATRACGQTVTVAPDRPQKTDGNCPTRGARDAAPHSPGLCGSTGGPLLAPASRRHTDRTLPRRWHPAVPPLSRLGTAAGGGGACLCGGTLMLQLTPHSRIFVATEPVDFHKGIDGLGAVCRQRLGDNPLEGAVYVFRNRAGTALKLLLYDGQGYWMMMKRLSQGRFLWWPTSVDARVPLSARELIILLWNGDPVRAQMAHDWRRVA